MQEIFLVIQLVVSIALVIVILMQRSEGGAASLTGGGGGGGMGGLMSARGATNFLTRLTAILATLFMGISLVLAMLAGSVATETGSVMDNAQTPAQDAPAATPAPAPGAETAPAQPKEPAAPAVPFSE